MNHAPTHRSKGSTHIRTMHTVYSLTCQSFSGMFLCIAGCWKAGFSNCGSSTIVFDYLFYLIPSLEILQSLKINRKHNRFYMVKRKFFKNVLNVSLLHSFVTNANTKRIWIVHGSYTIIQKSLRIDRSELMTPREKKIKDKGV